MREEERETEEEREREKKRKSNFRVNQALWVAPASL